MNSAPKALPHNPAVSTNGTAHRHSELTKLCPVRQTAALSASVPPPPELIAVNKADDTALQSLTGAPATLRFYLFVYFPLAVRRGRQSGVGTKNSTNGQVIPYDFRFVHVLVHALQTWIESAPSYSCPSSDRKYFYSRFDFNKPALSRAVTSFSRTKIPSHVSLRHDMVHLYTATPRHTAQPQRIENINTSPLSLCFSHPLPICFYGPHKHTTNRRPRQNTNP
jgi:hypothetical protein